MTKRGDPSLGVGVGEVTALKIRKTTKRRHAINVEYHSALTIWFRTLRLLPTATTSLHAAVILREATTQVISALSNSGTLTYSAILVLILHSGQVVKTADWGMGLQARYYACHALAVSRLTSRMAGVHPE